jgi:hypothetical protein
MQTANLRSCWAFTKSQKVTSWVMGYSILLSYCFVKVFAPCFSDSQHLYLCEYDERKLTITVGGKKLLSYFSEVSSTFFQNFIFRRRRPNPIFIFYASSLNLFKTLVLGSLCTFPPARSKLFACYNISYIQQEKI